MNSSTGSRSGVLLTIIALHIALLTYAVIAAKRVKVTPPEVPQVLMALLISPSIEKPTPPPVRPAPPVPKPQAHIAEPTPPVKTVVKERTEPPVLNTESAAPAQQARAEPATPAPAAPPTPPAPTPVAAVIPPSFHAAYLNNPPPAYPPLARRMGDEGKVMLRVYVTPEGTAGEVRVLTSSGSPMFDEAALAAVKQWRFVPAKQGENAVAAWVQVPIVFKLG